jgi:flagellar hook assembly protein FlgD
VNLDVFDIEGRLVTRLVKEDQSAGDHQVTWDGRDEAGNVLPSGVYLSRLTTSRGVATEKIVVTR